MSDQLTEVYASIDALVDYALDHLDLDPRNADWTRNQIFALFHLDSYPGTQNHNVGGVSVRRSPRHCRQPKPGPL